MVRPDDIPQDVWEAAKATGTEMRKNQPIYDIEPIARAIMAERERCALEARTALQDWLMAHYGAKGIPDGLRVLPAEVATAIRKGAQP
jgi:hypothetical protein